MRTSDLTRIGLGLAVCASLSACGEGGSFLDRARSLTAAPAEAPVVTQLTLARAARFSAPKGYCIDPPSSRPGDGFALVSSCARLGHGEAGVPLDGLITVQVGASGSASLGDDPAALSNLLTEPVGRALLSARGQGDDISNVETELRDAAVIVRFDDLALEGQTIWRGFADQGSRLVTVSVRPVGGAVLDPKKARALLMELLQAVTPAG